MVMTAGESRSDACSGNRDQVPGCSWRGRWRRELPVCQSTIDCEVHTTVKRAFDVGKQDLRLSRVSLVVSCVAASKLSSDSQALVRVFRESQLEDTVFHAIVPIYTDKYHVYITVYILVYSTIYFVEYTTPFLYVVTVPFYMSFLYVVTI
jgi:hypothetical protein